MFVIRFLLGAAAIYALTAAFYLYLITLAAFVFRKKTDSAAAPLRLLFVVPAHNEAGQISQTVQSILNLDYPADHRAVLVLADNCTDATADAARDAGAIVVERHNPDVRGKGQALNWLFTTHSEIYAEADAVAIIDADTRVDERFAREVAASLAAPGVDVVQGFYGVANPEENWRPALLEAALAVFHHLRPAGRVALGGTAGLKGNGMAFRTRILQDCGYPAFSIVEDIEFSVFLALRGVRVFYNPDAQVFGEMATQSGQAAPQRQRWEGGRYGLLRAHSPALLRTLFTRPNMPCFDMLMDLLIPPLAMLMMLLGGLFLLGLLISKTVAWLMLAGLLILLIYVGAGLWLKHVPPYVWRALLRAPAYMLWKIPLYAQMLIRRVPTEWHRTQRKSEMK